MKHIVSTLDLHGIKHHDVEDVLIDHFFWKGNVNTVVITGNSTQMKNIVVEWLEENDFSYFIPSINSGRIEVLS